MQVNSGSAQNIASLHERGDSVDNQKAFEMIDKSDFESCRIMLAISAPDLGEEIYDMMQSGADKQVLLASAREFVKQAYLREKYQRQ